MARLLAAFIVASSSTPVLTRRGWTADSLRAGERVTVRAQPYRDRTSKFVLLQTITKADSTALAAGTGPPRAGPPPRAKELFGVWQTFGARGGDQGIAPGAPDQPAVMGMDRWRNAPELELLSNKCDLEVAHRYLDGE
jgi:hypothetical protein